MAIGYWPVIKGLKRARTTATWFVISVDLISQLVGSAPLHMCAIFSPYYISIIRAKKNTDVCKSHT